MWVIFLELGLALGLLLIVLWVGRQPEHPEPREHEPGNE